MSYTSLDLDGVANCPICGEEGNRRVHSGYNLSLEEREEFEEYEIVECPIHGDVDLSYTSTIFPGWEDGKNILEIFQHACWFLPGTWLEVDRNNFRSLRSSS